MKARVGQTAMKAVTNPVVNGCIVELQHSSLILLSLHIHLHNILIYNTVIGGIGRDTRVMREVTSWGRRGRSSGG